MKQKKRVPKLSRVGSLKVPADYTCLLDLDGNSLLALSLPDRTKLVYNLNGWIEESLSKQKGKRDGQDSARITIQNVNIGGILLSPCNGAYPKHIHLALKTGARPVGELDLKTGLASLVLPVELEYPELETVPKQLRRRLPKHVLPSIIPLETSLFLRVEYDTKAGRFSATGSGHFPGLPPFTDAEVPAFFFGEFICAKGNYCAEVCLHIKVALEDDGGGIIDSVKRVSQIVEKVNNIWGCGEPGQCCIRFRIERVVYVPELPETVELRNKRTTEDSKRVRRIDRSSECYNVYLIKDVSGDQLAGQTAYGSLSGTIVRTTRRRRVPGGTQLVPLSDDKIAQILAHELGHALCLARGPGRTDPEGLWGHSTNRDNLMFGETDLQEPGGTRLNKKQCQRARACTEVKLKELDEPCEFQPGEGELV